MPELPEVETTRCAIAPYLVDQVVKQVVVRERRLRWPVSPELEANLTGAAILTVTRRAKYLLLETESGTVLLHLGMSGSLRILSAATPVRKHDHVDIEMAGGYCLRLTDPRRFGALLWTFAAPELHPLLCHLGPEPFSDTFSADYLYARTRGRKISIKSFIMDSRVVVGVGNIYANEALFRAGIDPLRAAGRISRFRLGRLVTEIRAVLTEAIVQGGTTLRDFVSGAGKPGYFQQSLRVYGREHQPCPNCGALIRLRRLGQRATYHCAYCQR